MITKTSISTVSNELKRIEEMYYESLLRKHAEEIQNIIDASLSSKSGFYGPRGWTLSKGILQNVLPYSSLSFLDRYQTDKILQNKNGKITDFLPVDSLSATVCKRLITALPPQALNEKQNGAPRLTQFLKVCINNPQLTLLAGYVITGFRSDERLSIDSIEVKLNITDMKNQEYLTGQDIWEFAKMTLNWYPSCEPPDEINLVGDEINSNKGKENYQLWRFWWD